MIFNIYPRLKSLIYYIVVYPYYKLRFGKLGAKSRLVDPLKIEGYANISIGKNVLVESNTWLACLPLTGKANSALIIKDGCRIGNFNHIYATFEIIIEENVLTADKVYISDNAHSYEDIEIPIYKQPIKQGASVVIGSGTWLGENVCVISARIGRGCVIGANSVVTKDIPDYCVAVGAPAKIIKRYDAVDKSWKKTDKKGEFIVEFL